MTLTNKQILKQLPNRAKLKKEISKITKEIEKLYPQKTRLENLVGELDKVKLVYKGVPLSYFMEDFGRLDIWKKGEYYINAQNQKTWGVRLHDKTTYGGEWLGSSFTKKEAVLLCKEFCISKLNATEFSRKHIVNGKVQGL